MSKTVVSKTRILVVNRHIQDTVGGSETQCHEIASELVKLRHNVTYAICSPKRTTYNVPYSVFPLSEPFGTSFKKALDECRPDIVYWRYNKNRILRSVLASRRRKIKFVFAISHANDLRIFSVKPFYSKDLGLLRYSWRVFNRIKDSLVAAFNYYAVNFVDGVVFQHSGQIPTNFCGTYKVIFNSYPCLRLAPAAVKHSYVLWVANIKKAKNPEYFIRLADDLQNTGVEFVMVGKIEDSGYAELLGDSSALPGNFRYVGFKDPDTVNSLIKNCMLVVHTCSTEGFPNIFLQAWLQKKSVVSLYFDPGNLLSAHNIGICSENYRTFKNDVAKLISTPDLRDSMGEHAHCFALQYCNREKNVKLLEEFFVELTKGNRNV